MALMVLASFGAAADDEKAGVRDVVPDMPPVPDFVGVVMGGTFTFFTFNPNQVSRPGSMANIINDASWREMAGM